MNGIVTPRYHIFSDGSQIILRVKNAGDEYNTLGKFSDVEGLLSAINFHNACEALMVPATIEEFESMLAGLSDELYDALDLKAGIKPLGEK
jgi:hypothetical protein